jgi:hypothetical protein
MQLEKYGNMPTMSEMRAAEGSRPYNILRVSLGIGRYR